MANPFGTLLARRQSGGPILDVSQWRTLGTRRLYGLGIPHALFKCGKTVLANFLSDATEAIGGEYNPTQGVRILEFESSDGNVSSKSAGCEIELWDCGGDLKFESCWPAMIKDAQGVILVFNPDLPSHLKELEMWHSSFVHQQRLQDNQCLLFAHHKPGSGADRGRPALASSLTKLKLVHSNLDEEPEDVRMEFLKFLDGVVNSMSESRDREEMSIIT